MNQGTYQTQDRKDLLPATYVLPIAAESSQARKLAGYLHRLCRTIDEVIVVDGSPEDIFQAHAQGWPREIWHIRPGAATTNGKVAGVIAGVMSARHEQVIVADDDVRYRRAELERMLSLLETCEVVRPQNVFRPLPWHARWDMARSLINRLLDGDWPGTLGVRRSAFVKAGGYSGEVLFENLEMVRTIEASGGRENVALDLFVARRPPCFRHFRSQRVRQAYDEWARPAHFLAQLAILPVALSFVQRGEPGKLLAMAACSIAAAELGRRKGNGRAAFPATSALWAPAWLAERAVTSWMAVGARLMFGGVRYRSGRLKLATLPKRMRKKNVELNPDQFFNAGDPHIVRLSV
jgi:hypothetical protein